MDESLVGKTAKVSKSLAEDLPYKDEIKFINTKRVFNNAKVESHSAIIPTYVKPKRLSADEQIVYTAIKNRFIMQFMPIAEYEETKLITKMDDSKGTFYSKGRVQLIEGWKKVENIQSKDNLLPLVQMKDMVSLIDSEVTTHVTKPPKYHTEKTLLRLMETCGKNFKEDDEENEDTLGSILTGFSIGTPATRADTMKKLKDVGYITAEGKNLRCTELGEKLVETFPVQDLFDLEFTGRLEKVLSDIQRGNASKQEFLNVIFAFTKDGVETIKNEQDVIINEIASLTATKEVLGVCPQCGSKVIEGYKGFGCNNWKSGCKFVIWKNDKYLATMKKSPQKRWLKHC